jgi:hypothetical protein
MPDASAIARQSAAASSRVIGSFAPTATSN